MPQKKTTTHISDAAIKALVAQSVADALAEHEANRSKNGDDNHDSGSGGKRQQEIHADLKYVKSLEKEIDELESEKAEFSDMYDVILHDCVSKDVMCSYLMALSDLDVLTELQCMYLHKKNIRFLLKLLCKIVKNSELKKLIEKGKGKYVDIKFDRSSIIRQPNAQRIPKPSVLGKPTPFSDSLERKYFPKTRSVLKANVSEGLSKPVTAQTLPQVAKKAVSNTNVLRPGIVNHKPNVSRPQLKSNQSRDKVLPNNSQVGVKKTQVEVHPRIPSVSNKIKSVTTCKDSLNSRTLNANAVCATCNKCLVDSENQVKFATCTLHSVALTWWNTHVQTIVHEAAYGMSWKTLMKMMTEKYCPRNEIRKLKMELWDLKVKGTDLASYTQRFQELALLCRRMFFEESDKIEKYIGGLPDMIHGSVVASKPTTMQEAIEIATELMDKKIRTFSEREIA
nr:reverse transcriptase domain-containing protein [Tanacetum cinerariifolium]